MTDTSPNFYTGFNGHRRIASGPLQTVALVVKQAIESGAADSVLIFDDATGRSIDLDTQGSAEELAARFAQSASNNAGAEAASSAYPHQVTPDSGDSDGRVDKPRDRGRPKLGVVPREVTLLPRHWEWLAIQPGGASVALRKLVEEARRTHSDKDRRRKAQERAYHFISAMAGNLPNFEEATRALFANDQPRFCELVTVWADDVRDYAIRLAFGEDNPVSAQKSSPNDSIQMTTPNMSVSYLEPTQESGRAFVMRQMQGNIVMLNLLRFRQTADYSATPELAPGTPISGAAAFQRYIEHTLPYLRETGGDLTFLGAGGSFLIGPEAERWDMAMLVRQQSVESFLAFASHKAYLAGMGHRTAAVEDSRLLPLTEVAAAIL